MNVQDVSLSVPPQFDAPEFKHLHTAVNGVIARHLTHRIARWYIRNQPSESVIDTRTYTIKNDGTVLIGGVPCHSLEEANKVLIELAFALEAGEAQWLNEQENVLA